MNIISLLLRNLFHHASIKPLPAVPWSTPLKRIEKENPVRFNAVKIGDGLFRCVYLRLYQKNLPLIFVRIDRKKLSYFCCSSIFEQLKSLITENIECENVEYRGNTIRIMNDIKLKHKPERIFCESNFYK